MCSLSKVLFLIWNQNKVTQYNNVNVKLSNLRLDKLKAVVRKAAEVASR